MEKIYYELNENGTIKNWYHVPERPEFPFFEIEEAEIGNIRVDVDKVIDGQYLPPQES